MKRKEIKLGEIYAYKPRHGRVGFGRAEALCWVLYSPSGENKVDYGEKRPGPSWKSAVALTLEEGDKLIMAPVQQITMTKGEHLEQDRLLKEKRAKEYDKEERQRMRVRELLKGAGLENGPGELVSCWGCRVFVALTPDTIDKVRELVRAGWAGKAQFQLSAVPLEEKP